MGTNVPNGPSLCALAAEFAIAASQQNVRVAKANLKNGRFISDSFRPLPILRPRLPGSERMPAPIRAWLNRELAEVSSAESEYVLDAIITPISGKFAGPKSRA
jgi:hypothetical protein